MKKTETKLSNDMLELQIEADLFYHNVRGCREYIEKNDHKKLKECYDLLLTRLSKMTFKASAITEEHDL
jgi:hypothetical protein